MKNLEDLEKFINSELASNINSSFIKHDNIYLNINYDELVNILASKIDSLGWKTVVKLNDKLPSNIRSKTIEESSKIGSKENFNMSSISKMFNTSKIKPGFKRKIILKQLQLFTMCMGAIPFLKKCIIRDYLKWIILLPYPIM